MMRQEISWEDSQTLEEYMHIIRTLRLTEAYLRRRGFNEESIERISYIPISVLETFAQRELAA